jgi:hypothetical protein
VREKPGLVSWALSVCSAVEGQCLRRRLTHSIQRALTLSALLRVETGLQLACNRLKVSSHVCMCGADGGVVMVVVTEVNR